MSTHTRRTFLASASIALASGCVSNVSDNGQSDNEFCRYEVRAVSFDPATELPPDYNRFQRALARRAIRRGRSTAVYGPRPLKEESYVVLDGAYHRVVLRDSRVQAVPAIVMTIEWDAERTAPANATVRQFSELPRADQKGLRSAVYGGLYREQVHPDQRLVHSGTPVLYPGGTEESALASCDSCWVRWNDRVYRLSSHGGTTVNESVYTFGASQVAPNATAFRRMIADEYLVNIDGYPPEELAIVDKAIAGGYEKRADSRIPAVERLMDRLGNQTTSVPESGGGLYVEYEGTRYRLIFSGACQGVD